jgi:hypothetical protein
MQMSSFNKTKNALLSSALLLTILSSCYTYRLETHAQAGSEVTSVNASSYFWGLIQSPKAGIKTPLCDSLDVNGVSVVRVRTNLGYALLTVLTLGIWCPMTIDYRCSKPCQVNGHL